MIPAKNILQVQPIAAYDDNYIWLLSDGHCAVVVDPGDAQPVIAYLKERQLVLQAILITHHHADHVGGIADLLDWAKVTDQQVPTVYGPAMEDIPKVNESLFEGDTLHIAPFVPEFWVMGVPGHTAGHIAYFLDNGVSQHLFCGDTLFASGCGRLFEGTAEQMYDSLTKLKNLPENTLVHCAHEYTLSNIKFAVAVEPDNQDLLDWKSRAEALRKVGKPTVPTTIAHEKRVNPFLRCEYSSVIRSALTHTTHKSQDPVSIFAALRGWKDGFK